MVSVPGIAVSPGNLLEIQIPSPTPDVSDQKLWDWAEQIVLTSPLGHPDARFCLRNSVLDNHFQEVVNSNIDRVTKYFTYAIIKKQIYIVLWKLQSTFKCINLIWSLILWWDGLRRHLHFYFTKLNEVWKRLNKFHNLTKLVNRIRFEPTSSGSKTSRLLLSLKKKKKVSMGISTDSLFYNLHQHSNNAVNSEYF